LKTELVFRGLLRCAADDGICAPCGMGNCRQWTGGQLAVGPWL